MRQVGETILILPATAERLDIAMRIRLDGFDQAHRLYPPVKAEENYYRQLADQAESTACT